MKQYLKTASILMAIAMVCAILLAFFNQITSPIIKDNMAKKERELYQEIFKDYSSENSIIKENIEDEAILAFITAKDASGNTLGSIVKVSGKNSYGIITLLVGIDNDNLLIGVKFLENGQSYQTLVNDHTKNNYESGITQDDILGIDVNCGATYGAELVKTLVTKAFEYKEGSDA